MLLLLPIPVMSLIVVLSSFTVPAFAFMPRWRMLPAWCMPACCPACWLDTSDGSSLSSACLVQDVWDVHGVDLGVVSRGCDGLWNDLEQEH